MLSMDLKYNPTTYFLDIHLKHNLYCHLIIIALS
jgi:hypothetical protein